MKSPQDVLNSVRAEMTTAAEALLAAASAALDDLVALEAGDAAALQSVRDHLVKILETCAFQDLTGQRLGQLELLIMGQADAGAADPLLNGPAANGEGLDQEAADRLLHDL